MASFSMKILIVSDAWHPQINGVVRTYEHLIPELIRLGHDVRVIGPGDFKYTFPMPGYAEIRLTILPFAHLSRQIDAYAPDLLHIATEGPLGVAARRYAIARKMRFTSCYHTHFPDYVAKRVAAFAPFLESLTKKGAIQFIRWFHSPSSCVLVATESLKKALLAWGFKAPIKFMTRGVDIDIFHTGDKNLFHDLKKPIALYVGRVAIEKNIPDFLNMPWEGSKVVVGHGPDLDKLKSGNPDVIFTGKKVGPELADHYRSADVFVFPSRTDTFGMVVIEALACGLPVAAYPVTGPIDIITEPLLGHVNNNLSEAARLCIIHSVPDDRKNREAYIRQNYTWQKAARQFLEQEFD